MKLKYLVIALMGLVFTSCAKTKAPEEVVKEFFAAIEAKDFDKVKELATKESSSMINMMEKAVDMAGNLDEEESKEVAKVECITEGDKGDCKCWGENEEEQQEVSVKKVDGQWKVHMSKQEMMKDAMGEMDNVDMDKAKEQMENIDLEKAMETFSEEIDSLGKTMEEGMKAKTIEAIDSLEKSLDEVKASLEEE